MSEPAELMSMPDRTEADAVAEVSAKPEVHDLGNTRHILTPPGWHNLKIETEKEKARPDRLRGVTAVENADSLIAAVNQQAPRSAYLPVVYGSERDLSVTAVLNHQQVTDPGEGPAIEVMSEAVSIETPGEQVATGWGDHRVALTLTRSPEWAAWLEASGDMMGQEDFAQFIEERADEIATTDPRHPDAPSPADMLDLAQTFQANLTSRFDRGIRLDSGRVQLTYHEDLTATAGSTKQMEIPGEFTIAVRPFQGSAPCYVQARLRYRVPTGRLSLGFILVRPDLVERTIFDEECERVAEALGVPVIRGSAPSLSSS